jgi:hypothetical protein
MVTVNPPPTLAWQWFPGALQLSWPTGAVNWRLQIQTNPLTKGLGSAWFNMPGPVTNPVLVPIDPSAGAVFLRLTPP